MNVFPFFVEKWRRENQACSEKVNLRKDANLTRVESGSRRVQAKNEN